MSAPLRTSVSVESAELSRHPSSSSQDVGHLQSEDNMEENAIVSVHPRQQIRSTGRHLLHYINSGPMSEGHVRLCNNDQRASDPSQNLCLFTPCLFAVGLSIFSVGVLMYWQHKFIVFSVFLIIFGSFSVGSALLYTLIYIFMFMLRQTRSSSSESNPRRGSERKSLSYTPDACLNASANEPEFDQFGDFEGEAQSVKAQNGPIDSVNEGSGLCGSHYMPPSSETVQLNVENLDFEIKSTQNLDASIWRTTNGEPPQSYLESFGDLPKDLLSSPSLKKGLDGYGDPREKQHLHKKSNSSNSKKRGIFGSLRNGQPFSMKTHGKSNSQTELLDCENEGENTLFHIESIGKDLEPQASTSRSNLAQTKETREEVTLVENAAAGNPSIVVHFNRKNNGNADSLIDTFH